MKAFILRYRQLCDVYRNDPQGLVLALTRDASAEVLRSDASALRAYAETLSSAGLDSDARNARALAETLSTRASGVSSATRDHIRAVWSARLAPRLRADGTPRAVYVDPTSDTARHSAGACRRDSSPDAHALRGDRGTYISYLRREGCEIPTHKVRHARKRKRRGGKKHKSGGDPQVG